MMFRCLLTETTTFTFSKAKHSSYMGVGFYFPTFHFSLLNQKLTLGFFYFRNNFKIASITTAIQ